ncbi:uncharacterized protein CDAR_419481 [Caerostris darwini]|uniref:Uncharacterized protein n=1 Tax=Caerostris darwini TaxID=1538125 RepID=A0AAV4PZ62_9ARAC|nr:uncharacterized protein CDAR_419481 [Caerostris darwini]
MPQQKKWQEYPRAIPYDDHFRKILQGRVYAENKIRRQWENKYGKTLHLYRADTKMNGDNICKDEQCRSTHGGTSLEVGAPTAERMNAELICATVPIVQHVPIVQPPVLKDCEGVVQPFCPTRCDEMIKPVKGVKLEDDERTSECPQRFRTLKFPPKLSTKLERLNILYHLVSTAFLTCSRCRKAEDEKANKKPRRTDQIKAAVTEDRSVGARK